MKYYMLQTNSIHFEMPHLNKSSFINGKLETTVAKWPTTDNRYPMMIKWRYIMQDDSGKDLASYVAESKFFIDDDGLPHDIQQLDRLINDLYLNAEIKWKEHTQNTPLHGNTLPTIMGENIESLRNQIISHLGLLNTYLGVIRE